MTDALTEARVQELRAQAKLGRKQASVRGASWPDYDRVVRIADEMDAEASLFEASAAADKDRGQG